MNSQPATSSRPSGLLMRALDWLERKGNKLPDPVLLFVGFTLVVWIASAILSGVTFEEIDPRSKEVVKITNLFSLQSFAALLSNMLGIFTGFHPLGVVLVSMLGVGVAQNAGLVDAMIKMLLSVVRGWKIIPLLVLVGLISHTASDAGYVLVIPIGAAIFLQAGRHPIAGLVLAFAAVSGGFSANLLVSGLDPMLSSLTQAAAEIARPGTAVNPMCNYYFTVASSLLIVGVAWLVTVKITEPRVKRTLVLDGDEIGSTPDSTVNPQQRKAVWCALGVGLLLLALLALWALPADSALRAPDGELTTPKTKDGPGAPLMNGIVPIIFLLFLLPGIVYGYMAGRFGSHKDVVKSMNKSLADMGGYMVMAFFAALFINAFDKSNMGVLIAVKGAKFLADLGAPTPVTLIGVIMITASVNIFIGSASAKWAMLAPILVPMMMLLGVSPELTQAAYRIGDSSTNIVTPFLPYFPMILAFGSRYCKDFGAGTLITLMLPYSVCFALAWTGFLVLWWMLGLPLGVGG